MNQYRDDLSAAQARIAELEGERDRAANTPDLEALEREHEALARMIPSRARAWLATGVSALVALPALVSMLFLASPYDHSPRFTVAIQMVVMFSAVFVATMTWIGRAYGLEKLGLAKRLLVAERERASLASRVRVADTKRVAVADELESEDGGDAAVRTTRPRQP